MVTDSPELPSPPGVATATVDPDVSPNESINLGVAAPDGTDEITDDTTIESVVLER